MILPNCKETTTNSIKQRFDESSRTSLTGLSVLLRNAMSIFTLMNPVGLSGFWRIIGREVLPILPLRIRPCNFREAPG
jgi:hypothetical protein